LTASRGLYRTRALLSPNKQVNGVISAWISVLLIVTALLFLLKVGSSYSRGSTVVFGFLNLPILLVSRTIIRRELRGLILNGTLSGPRCILIGDHQELESLSPLNLLQMFGVREVGRFEISPGVEIGQEKGVADSAIAAAKLTHADQVLLAITWADSERRQFVSSQLRILPLPVLLLPDRFARLVLSNATERLAGPPLIELQRAPLSGMELLAKRVLDLVFAGAGILTLLPLLLVVSIAIKIDSPGPLIFRQNRKGFNGREFKIYKFRTMTVLENGSFICQAKRNDKRVTRIGRLLRATSIDELPQLINVLRGDMSVVGPRPHAVAHDDEYVKAIANYAFRHHVKPGITGWAQVNGFRGETPQIELMRGRIDQDLWYINNWSLWLDLWIILRTCFELVRSRNAY